MTDETTVPGLMDCVERLRPLHARLCPRQVLGARLGLYAAELLDLVLPQSDKRVLVFVEMDGCLADGVSVATGAWFGRRTMRLVDFGKAAATFVDTETGHAVRVSPHPAARHRAARAAPDAPSRWHAQLDGYATLPDRELLQWRFVRLTVPVAAILGQPGVRVTCRGCGEDVMNEREVLVNGWLYCRACAGERYCLPLDPPTPIPALSVRPRRHRRAHVADTRPAVA